MPGTFLPPQMFDHELNPRKGWPSPYAVDKVLPMFIEEAGAYGDATHYRDDWKAGMVCHVHLDTNDNLYKFRLGLANDAVACFVFPNGKDFDVDGDKGTITGSGDHSLAVSGTTNTAGHVVALVALGAYELETTEFVGTGFTPGVPLTTVSDPGTVRSTEANNPGKIKAYTWAKWRAADDDDGEDRGCIGTVSDGGIITNEFGKQMIRFWPEHLPSPVGPS